MYDKAQINSSLATDDHQIYSFVVAIKTQTNTSW